MPRDQFPSDMPPLTRRRFALLPFAAGSAACALTSQTGAAALPAAASLAAELAKALLLRTPLIVMASLDGCPFCKTVRGNYLAPLHLQTGQPVVQLDMGSALSVLDFDSRSKSHDQILRAWRVTVAPTVLFFGASGREVADRLAGASIPDFYGAYLEERLRTGRRNMI